MMRLKELRLLNGLTQKQIAEKLNVRQNTYSQYENGNREIPLQSLIALSDIYDTSIDYIVGITDYDTAYPRNK